VTNQNLSILLIQSLNIKEAAMIHPAERNPYLVTEHSDLVLQIQKVQPGVCHPLDALPLMLLTSEIYIYNTFQKEFSKYNVIAYNLYAKSGNNFRYMF